MKVFLLMLILSPSTVPDADYDAFFQIHESYETCMKVYTAVEDTTPQNITAVAECLEANIEPGEL